jgi:hypothetical protein
MRNATGVVGGAREQQKRTQIHFASAWLTSATFQTGPRLIRPDVAARPHERRDNEVRGQVVVVTAAASQ